MTSEEWQHINQVLNDALEIPPEERSAFLDRATNGDTALRAEVESLLASFHDAGTFIEAPATAPGRLAQPESLSPGASLGPYRIVQLIAEGGMGAVYQAVRVDDLYRKVVAVKSSAAASIASTRSSASIPSGRFWRISTTRLSPSCWMAAPLPMAGRISSWTLSRALPSTSTATPAA